MMFVTVGSQKFPFDRLLRAADELCANGTIEGGCFAQTGTCAYAPRYMQCSAFLNRGEFQTRMAACDVVLTHGGTGAIIGAVKAGKKVIAVPRLARYGEHVDDHQIEIITQFAEMGLIEPCMNVDDLARAYMQVRAKNYLTYSSNTERFIADLGGYIDSLGGIRR